MGRRCKRLWALTYIAGIREPKQTWRPELKGVKGIGPVLGDALHADLEAYMLGKEWPFTDFPAEIATPMLPHLPDPKRSEFHVERCIGNHDQGVDLTGTSRNKDAPTRGLKVHGVVWAGFVDLSARRFEESWWEVYDYKSSKDIKRYSLTVNELRADVQCNLYAYDIAIERGQLETWCNWIYTETGDRRRAEPHRLVIRPEDALVALEAPSIFCAEELDSISSVDKAEPNPAACFEFGRTCIHHPSVGGTCPVQSTPGALMQARVPKKGNRLMPLSPDLLAKYGAKKPAEGAATTTKPNAEQPPADAAAAQEPAAQSMPEEKPTTAATPDAKANASKPKATKPKASAAKSTSSVVELAQAVADTEAGVAAAIAAHEEAVNALRAALG